MRALLSAIVLIRVMAVLLAVTATIAAHAQFNPYASTISTQAGTSYTVAQSDCGTTVNFTASTAIAVTLPGGINIGCPIQVIQGGAGQITLSAGQGASVLNPYGLVSTPMQGASLNVKVSSNPGGNAATWVVLGLGGAGSGFGSPSATANLGIGGSTGLTDSRNSMQFRFTSPTFNPADNVLTLISPGPQNAFSLQNTAPAGFPAMTLRDMFDNEVGAFWSNNENDAVVMGYQSGTLLTVTSVVYNSVVVNQTMGVVTGSPGSYVLTPETDNNYVSSFGTGTGGVGTYNMSQSKTIGSSGAPVQLALIAAGDGLELSNLSSVSSSFPPTFDLRQIYQPGGAATIFHAMLLDAKANMHLVTGSSCNGTMEDTVTITRNPAGWVGVCASVSQPATGVNFTVGRGGSLFTRGSQFDGTGAAAADLEVSSGAVGTPTILKINSYGSFNYGIIANTSPNRLDFEDMTTAGAPVVFSLSQDGTKTTTQTGPTKYTGAVASIPTTGGTITFATTQRLAIINPAGTLAALTVQLPACATANDGDERSFLTTQALTALTITAATGSVGNGAATSATAGAGHTYHCLGSAATWYQMY